MGGVGGVGFEDRGEVARYEGFVSCGTWVEVV